MFFTHGVSIYNLPEWWTHRTVLFEFQQANGNWAELTLPVAIMAVCVSGHMGADRALDHRPAALCIRRQSRRRAPAWHQYRRHAFHRIRLARTDGGHCGAGAGALCAGGRTQRPGRARARCAGGRRVLGGARLGGGRGTVLGCILGVFLISVTQNGLNLLGISPYAFKMIVGAIILDGHHAVECAARPDPGRHAAKDGEHDPGHPRDMLPRNAVALAPPRRASSAPKMSACCWRWSPWSCSFGSLSPRFLSRAPSNSVAFQLPELGLLTLAMLMPIISGGINLAVTFTANLCGLTLAWVLQGQWRARRQHPGLHARLHAGRRRRHRERAW